MDLSQGRPKVLFFILMLVFGAFLTLVTVLLLMGSLLSANEGLLLVESIMKPSEVPVVGVFSLSAYLVAFLFWIVLFLLVGVIWSFALFPLMDAIERVLFSLFFGLFVVPLNYLAGLFIVVTYEGVSRFGLGSDAFSGMLFLHQEQVYGVFNMFVMLLLGIIALLIREVLFPARTYTTHNSHHGIIS